MTLVPLPERSTPHLNKIVAAIANPKASAEDHALLKEIRERYDQWLVAYLARSRD